MILSFFHILQECCLTAKKNKKTAGNLQGVHNNTTAPPTTIIQLMLTYNELYWKNSKCPFITSMYISVKQKLQKVACKYKNKKLRPHVTDTELHWMTESYLITIASSTAIFPMKQGLQPAACLGFFISISSTPTNPLSKTFTFSLTPFHSIFLGRPQCNSMKTVK